MVDPSNMVMDDDIFELSFFKMAWKLIYMQANYQINLK